MPLSNREIYEEARKRLLDNSVLDQVLDLPSNFLREQLDTEISKLNQTTASVEMNRSWAGFDWSLICICIEKNILMMFWCGTQSSNPHYSSHHSQPGYYYYGPQPDMPPHSYYNYLAPWETTYRSGSHRSRLPPSPSPSPGPRIIKDDQQAQESEMTEAGSPAGEQITVASNVKNEQLSIKFKDAVGRKFLFPFDMCKTWKVMKITFLVG